MFLILGFEEEGPVGDSADVQLHTEVTVFDNIRSAGIRRNCYDLKVLTSVVEHHQDLCVFGVRACVYLVCVCVCVCV